MTSSIKGKSIIRASLLLFVFSLGLLATQEAYGQANRSVNRVRPQQGTRQYAKEAARVRLLTLGERLGLSDSQLEKLRKAQLKMETKCDKEKARMDKLRLKYEKEQQASTAKEAGFIQEFEAEFEKVLSPEQLEGYRLLRLQEAESERQIEPVVPDAPGPVIINENGGVGPVVKAQDPPLLY